MRRVLVGLVAFCFGIALVVMFAVVLEAVR